MAMRSGVGGERRVKQCMMGDVASPQGSISPQPQLAPWHHGSGSVPCLHFLTAAGRCRPCCERAPPLGEMLSPCPATLSTSPCVSREVQAPACGAAAGNPTAQRLSGTPILSAPSPFRQPTPSVTEQQGT
ncbi:molecular chaperone GroEL [Platysternon megacephalum]|uniref:Molecular chaperone GroEL n=1 Tax=Platysternon megacephalum TaxID=55544 RepID=A0A4D9DHY8_9SAUR|nr:molecular chaperone GroEL [Platysternon megacephalum]